MLLLILLLPIATALTGLLIWQYFKRVEAFAKDVPLAKAKKSFLGMDYSMMTMTDEERFHYADEVFQRHSNNGLFRLRLGPIMVLGVNHPDLVQKVLSHPDCLEKPFFYRLFNYDQGILNAHYKLWRNQRKALNPAFNMRIFYSFLPIFVECSRRLVTELSKCQDGETINMFKYTSRCSLEMVCSTMLGNDVLQRKGSDEFLEALDDYFSCMSRRLLSVHLYLEPMYMLSPTFWKETRARKQMRMFTSEVIKEKKQALLQSKKTPSKCTEEENFKKPQIFIDQLLSLYSNGRPFSDEEIYHNVFVVMVAGNDTSGLVVAYSCLFLAMYPQYQERVYAEIMEHFPNDNAEITADSLKLLEYTGMFIQEVMRLCPVAPNIARKCVKDIELDGLRIPAGNTFVFFFPPMHLRKDMWGPDAEKFDPDNFLPERCQARNPNCYMPFSAGPRNCIGGRYALISVKIMLMYIVKNFKLHTKLQYKDFRYKFGITLKLVSDHLVELEKRNVQ